MLPYRRRFPNNGGYIPKESVSDILRKHSGKIESQIRVSNLEKIDYSKEYETFKKELAPELSRYEKICRSLGNIIKLKVAKKDEDKIRKNLEIAHLDLEPWQSLSLSVISFLSVFFLGLLISIAVVLINGGAVESFPLLFFILTIMVSMFLFYFMNNYPQRLANQWRLKASSQMVPAILYIVVYMRHTSNLERAIAFAAEHLEYPLALDFKKVFYDVSIGKFSTIKSSLDNYLEIWEDYSGEFIEAFHLIESSLFEPSNERRINTLEKSLQVILDGVHDKMLKFTHDVRSPLTNVYMLGVVLPTLALALLPLASAMLGGILKSIHVFLLFNLIIPFLVFYLTDKVLLMRPGGYGETSLLERNPLYSKYKSSKPYAKAALISLPFIIIGLLPLIFLFLQIDFTFASMGLGSLGEGGFFGVTISDGGKVSGPMGIGALILGMFFPLGIAMFFAISFKDKTKELIIQREKTNQLENEFGNSLFQLGNRIGNGTPPELAFGRVAESSKGLVTEDFFRRVNYNIVQSGMGVESAIFDKRRGVLNYYSSNLIGTSMRILVQSVKKGLNAASKSLMSISEYLKNIKKITSRLKDMLAEVISDMKSNMTFLAPLLSGIVVGLASMITSILGTLKITELSGEAVNLVNIESMMNIFDVSSMIPPYLLQISIGIYLIEIIFILTGALVVINSGQDKLQKKNLISKNLKKGILLYFITAIISAIALFFLTSVVLGNLV
jgi:hypothetical protein